MVAHTRRISPGSGLNVGTAMPCARPERPAWSEPSPQAPSTRAQPLQLPGTVGGGADPRARGDVLGEGCRVVVVDERDDRAAEAAAGHACGVRAVLVRPGDEVVELGNRHLEVE